MITGVRFTVYNCTSMKLTYKKYIDTKRNTDVRVFTNNRGKRKNEVKNKMWP